MGDNKRKRGRKPKPQAPETLDFPTATPTTSSSSPAIDDDAIVFSVANVELIDNNNNPAANRRRGRPRKLPDHHPEKTLNNGTTAGGAHNSVSADGAVVAMARAAPSMDAVVKVFCTHTEPNFSLPWQRKRQYSSSSSGFVIGGRRVLTNAHSVEHYTQVKLKKRGSDTKYVATVLAIGTECDIGEIY